MDDTADTRLPRIAPLLLIGVLVWLAVGRPGHLAGESGVGERLWTSLVAVVVVGYAAWCFHGLVPAAAAITLLRLIEPTELSPTAALERVGDGVFLATIGIGIAAGSRQGRPGPIPWVLLVAAGLAVAVFGWYGLNMAAPEDQVARDRLRHVTLAVAVLTVMVGCGSRPAVWLDRLKMVGVVIGLPAAGIVAARLVRGEWPRLLEGGDWPALASEWRAAIQGGTWDAGAWCWAAPWLAGGLVLIGVWRTLARGRAQLRRNRPPLAWLLSVAGVGALLALGARPLASGSLALAAVGVLLSVFGAADLILALVERIQLQPPEPGPSTIPRVK